MDVLVKFSMAASTARFRAVAPLLMCETYNARLVRLLILQLWCGSVYVMPVEMWWCFDGCGDGPVVLA
jgi:hypothetical protein